VGPAVLGDEAAVRLDHHQGGDALDPVLLLQLVGDAGPVLHAQPVAVGLLHVAEHVLGRAVRGDEHDLHVVHLAVEVRQHGGELSAGRAPVGGEVEQNQILALQSRVCLHGAPISFDKLV